MMNLIDKTVAYPFATTVVIMLFLFFLTHFSLSRIYPLGAKATIIAGITYLAFSAFFLLVGLNSIEPVWQNVSGLTSGIFLWCVFGEVASTLKSNHQINTRIVIGHQNIPILVLLGAILSYLLLWHPIKLHPTIWQLINTGFGTWVFHVVLLTIYYHPIFGGALVQANETIPAIKVWSKHRLIASLAVLFVYGTTLIPLVLVKLMPSPDINLKIASGYWVVILGWSFIEVAKKLFVFKPY
ncbi:MAG: hypothetical protein AAB038_05525 [Planctomycetota bacterium]